MKTIVLLTGNAEWPFLAAWLRREKMDLEFVAVDSLYELAAIPDAELSDARLLGYSTNVIVPAAILTRLGHGAYNFHPGSPRYPGWAPASFAVYDGAMEFGATAHEMLPRVNSGPIVGVETFSVPSGTTGRALAELAYLALARLFKTLAPVLATQSEPLAHLELVWGGRKSSRRSFADMCAIPLDISRDELSRRIDAFGGGSGSAVPAITLHGRRFELVDPTPPPLPTIGGATEIAGPDQSVPG